MPVTSHTFWLPRRGNSPAEYEDAAAADDLSGRYGMADGASEGCFTGFWARLLVEHFVNGIEADVTAWPGTLAAPQEHWDADVRGRNLPYHAQPWVRQGAFATFLGVTLADSTTESCQWQAVAVGDTCLFHTRGDALLRAFPVEHSKQFGNAPRLVGARAAEDDVRTRCRFWPDGCSRAGDRLWMMTDALAQWCLAEQERGGNPWGELQELLSDDGGGRFAQWIEGLRTGRGLRNDDVTLLAILFGG